jgi:hypothetical protein
MRLGGHVELREFIRYNLDLPLTFTWINEQGDECHGTGFTRDISSGGMYVFSDSYPDETTPVRCSVLLPRLDGAESMGGIEALGRVVRRAAREPLADEPAGFALIGDCMVLCMRVNCSEYLLKKQREEARIET